MEHFKVEGSGFWKFSGLIIPQIHRLFAAEGVLFFPAFRPEPGAQEDLTVVDLTESQNVKIAPWT